MADMPKMQEHFSAGACMARHGENGVLGTRISADMPKMQEHFSAGACMARHGENGVLGTRMSAGMPKMQEHFSAVPGWSDTLKTKEQFPAGLPNQLEQVQ